MQNLQVDHWCAAGVQSSIHSPLNQRQLIRSAFGPLRRGCQHSVTVRSVKRGRVLLERGDTMRLLFCLLLGLQVLLSGCGESQEEAVAPVKKSSENAAFDEQQFPHSELSSKLALHFRCDFTTR